MLIRRLPDILSSEITDESTYLRRRDFIAAAGLGLAGLGGLLPAAASGRLNADKLTPYEDVTGYNNYYEFGTDKGDPAQNATRFRTRPWKVEIAGEVKRPAVYDLDDFLRGFTPEERVYRLRCVEGWSMVIPWSGIPFVNIIDRLEPLEVAVCAQHNNGGLAGNIWYESTNVRHLFPIGEVNGSHGVSRPGGSALNAGQVGGFRAAEFIANRYAGWTLPEAEALEALRQTVQKVESWAESCLNAETPWLDEMKQLQDRMTRAGAHIRSLDVLDCEAPLAWQQVERLAHQACKVNGREKLRYAFRVRQLAFAQAVYLEAIQFALQSGAGSRGSAIVLDPQGTQVHDMLDASWKIQPEETRFRAQVLETLPRSGGSDHRWVPCRPIPEPDSWFETTWARFRKGEIWQE